ncbi:phenylalanine--tRNA ligase subunit beta [Tissierella sp. Yu-01]|uniref:phenylalanine--tRNA ligase subunit beta n=1 Tax=Tissierella sp. Yu-01 TaxID=3035694 RepID=UPI00240DBA2D|nr:phenylalanine--tRNA ligase subunit beta [Tissierella sp. Yu-01]WFA09878.1 phenylalanine--tRNA ligase subunit beta [Tissierella sp. Yu-01]
MLLPIKWLKDYIETDKSPRELADGLTLSGSHVESIESHNDDIVNVVVGKILNIEKHPNADKLVICNVDVGNETLVIVTGAKNLTVGDYIPVAKIGAKLPNGVEINKTDFRGVDSFGMLCSLTELGFPDNVIPKEMKEGIFILDREYTLGMDILDALQLKEQVIEFEITPNRPDCLSIIGMAREAAATFNYELKEPNIEIQTEADDIMDYTNGITVETDNCSRFYSRVIKDVVIKPSPLWLQTRLMEAGVRPISNIVDITNFVMLEYGQPLHAYDLNYLNGKKIIVRQATNGEKLTTLDGTERILDEKDIIIADSEGPIGIAGVMGGLDSEITNETKTVLLEGANFNSRNVRLTSKKLGLRTEASTRFEKAIDPNLCSTAVERVCQLVELIGAGTVVKGNIDVYNKVTEPRELTLRPERSNMLLGVDIPVEDMIASLNGLGIKSTYDGKLIHSLVPTFRLDINIEADLIEEVGRLYGFHNIQPKALLGGLTRGEKPFKIRIEDKVKAILQGLGLNEVMTYSFISPKAYDKIKLPEDDIHRKYIKLINPLGEDYSTMRTTLLPNMLDLLSRNYNRGVESVYAYEIGNTFIPKSIPVTELPEEKKVLSIGAYGEVDFYEIKEIIEITLSKLGIYGFDYERLESNPTYHPGRTAKIFSNGELLGVVGEIHPDVLENYDIKTRLYSAQLDFDKVVELTNLDIKYKPLPKYPAMIRDIAIVVKEDVLVGDIEKIILKHGGGLIERLELFDIYRGSQIDEGLKSVAYSIVYRSYDRTLTDEEVNKIQELIIKDLENSIDAKLRSF